MSDERAGQELQHEVHVEEGDLVCYRLRGDITAQHLRDLTAVERPLWEANERIYVLVDMRATKSISAGLLRMVPEVYRGAPTRIGAVFGAGFALQVLVNAISRALSVLGKPAVPRFFPDEASARAWLERRRAEPGRDSRFDAAPSRPSRP